jgi:hypothetical protein
MTLRRQLIAVLLALITGCSQPGIEPAQPPARRQGLRTFLRPSMPMLLHGASRCFRSIPRIPWSRSPFDALALWPDWGTTM